MRTKTAILKDVRAIRKKFRNHQTKQCAGICRNECKLILRNPFKVQSGNFCRHADRWHDQYVELFVEIMTYQHKKDPSILNAATANLLIPEINEPNPIPS